MRKFFYANILILFSALFNFSANAQRASTIDSLQKIISKASNDSTRIEAYHSWSLELYNNNLLDSAIVLIDIALAECEESIISNSNSQINLQLSKKKSNLLLDKATYLKKNGKPHESLEILKQCIEISKEINYKSGVAWCTYQTGDIYDFGGNLSYALELYFKSLEIFKEIGESKGIGKVLNAIGTVYDYQGDLELAMDYYSQSLTVFRTINDLRGIADQLNNIGVIHYLRGNYIDALDYYYQSAAINENIISSRHVYAITINNIGLVYDALGDMLSALDYYNKSLQLFESLDFGSGIIMPLNNLGDTYLKQNDFLKALDYYTRSVAVCEANNDEQGLAYTLEKICSLYTQQKKFKEADKYCSLCLESYLEIGDKHGIALSLVSNGKLNEEKGDYLSAETFYRKGLATYTEIGDRQGLSKNYALLGKILVKQGKTEPALTNALESYRIAKEIYDVNEISHAAELLSSIYEKNGDYKKAYAFLNEHTSIEKNNKNDEVKKIVQEQYYRLQYEKRAASDSIAYAQNIAIKNLELEKKKEQTQRQRWIIFSVIAGLAIFLFFSIALLRLLVLKRNAYINLSQSHSEINQQKEEIISQRDEIENQRDMLQNQNNMLEQFRTHTTHSLRYAQSIQAAILPSEKILQQISPDYFVFSKPCELVSGDFFWATSFDDYHIFCVADCTGHGVPGAFMSILGITALNDIVARHRVTKPAEILGYLRESVIDALSQNDPEQQHKDGMDIAMCSLNKKTNVLQFAGAGIPLLVATNSLLQNNVECNSTVTNENNFSLFEIKGDIMPVGSSPRMQPFTNKTIPLPTTNGVYLFLVTDGFQGQRGGEQNKKFGVKQLRNLLLTNANLSPELQYNTLNSTFEEWKNGAEQVDDVTILGIKL